jgi:hypothetical protein
MNIRSLGFWDIRVCDIMEVDIMEFRVLRLAYCIS